MTETAQEQEESAEAVGTVLGQLMDDFAATGGVILTTLGLKLGLWDALAAGPATAETVAARADAAVPYVREWLRSQAAAGYVGYDPAAGTFRLAPGVAAALGGGPLSGLTGGMAAQFRVWWSELDRYEDAFRTGRGISWGSLPAGHADGMDLITRAVVAPALVADWIPALDGVAGRLAAGAAVADIGCGYGAPAIAMAQAFPASRFTGFDADDASVARARRAALAAGVADRVSFEVAAAADVPVARTTSSPSSTPCTTWVILSARCGAPGRCSPMTGWCCWSSTPAPIVSRRTSARQAGSSTPRRRWSACPTRSPSRLRAARSGRSRASRRCGGWRQRAGSPGCAGSGWPRR